MHLELVFLDADRRTGPRPLDLTPIKTVHPIGSSNATLHRPNDSRGSAHQSSSATFKCCRESVYSWYRRQARSGETGGGMGDIDSKIARSWMRILRAGAASLLTMAAALLTERAASAQEYRGTEQQRVACTPDVFRLCSWEIPNVERIVSCLRREKSQLSAGCRQVFEIEATASRAALNSGAPHHVVRHHFARHRSPGEYEKSDMRE